MPWSYSVLDPVSQAYPKVQGRSPTCYSPVRHSSTPEGAFPFDLHVLSTPPAFVLSQNQTLQTKTTQPKRPGGIRIRTSLKPNQRHQNNWHPNNKATHETGRRGVPHTGSQKQQTKTTKHTIEFSNNTPILAAHATRGLRRASFRADR